MIRTLRVRFFLLVWPLVVVALVVLGVLLGRWSTVEIRRLSSEMRGEQEFGGITERIADSLRTVPAGDAAAMQANDPEVWRLLAIAYGKDGQIPMSALAQAQRHMAMGDKKMARAWARRALEGLPVGSRGALQADDIISATGGPDGEEDE